MIRPIPPIRRSASLVVVSLFLAGCDRGERAAPEQRWAGTIETRGDGVVVVRNPPQGAWPAGQAWTLEEEPRIGFAGGSGPSLLRDVAAIEVDRLGRAWVLVRGEKELRVFDAYGKHVRTLGGEGSGPGQLRDPVGLAWAPDGTVWVADPGNARFAIFDTAGHWMGERPRAADGHALPWRGAFGGDAMLSEIASVPRAGGGRRLAVLRYDASLSPLDTLLLPAGPFGDSAAALPAALSPDGMVWVGRADGGGLARLRFSRDMARTLERIVERADSAGAASAVQDIVVDSAGLWVRTAAPDSAAAAFDVFDAEGRYQGRVLLPGGMDAVPSPIIRGGALYGVVSDSTGVSFVVRARIRRGPAPEAPR